MSAKVIYLLTSLADSSMECYCHFYRRIRTMNHIVAGRSALHQVLGMFKLMRPKQWIKNGFVLAPLIFAGEFLDADAVTSAMLAACLFCLASSVAYIINDVDRKSTRLNSSHVKIS